MLYEIDIHDYLYSEIIEYNKLFVTGHYLAKQSILPYYKKYQYLISDFEEDTRAQRGSQDQGERLRRS